MNESMNEQTPQKSKSASTDRRSSVVMPERGVLDRTKPSRVCNQQVLLLLEITTVLGDDVVLWGGKGGRENDNIG